MADNVGLREEINDALSAWPEKNYYGWTADAMLHLVRELRAAAWDEGRAAKSYSINPYRAGTSDG